MKKHLLLLAVVLFLFIATFALTACCLFEKSSAGSSGVGIDKIEKTGTKGLVDTYTITMTDGTTTTFTVTNGKDGKDGKNADGTSASPNAPTSDDYFRFTLLEDDSYEITARYQDLPPRLVIPSTYNGKAVTSIKEGAFYERESMDEIVIPDSVTSIGASAFQYCTGLTSVTIPNSVTEIGGYAFKGCKGLTTINYQGKKEDWDAIQKGSDWNWNTGNYTIHCTNGDVEKRITIMN